MESFFRFVEPWQAFALGGGTGLLSWGLWSLRKAYSSKEDLAQQEGKMRLVVEQKENKLRAELEEQEVRLNKVELELSVILTRMESMPTRKEVTDLLVKLAEISTKLDNFDKRLANNFGQIIPTEA